VVSGRARIRLADGTQCEVKAGDVFDMPPGQDMWTMGNEPYVAIDFTAGSHLASPQDSTTPPDHHAVLFENQHVRVLEVGIPAGGTSGRHSHPKSVVYQLSQAHVRMSLPDGTSREVDLVPGQVTWTDGTTHTVDNIGPTDDVGVFVELKQ
jgi:quercetin dioxygenase-like cupin family protein